MSGIFGKKEYHEQLSFGKCPVCGGELARGRVHVVSCRGFETLVGWYNEDKVQKTLEKPFRLFPFKFDAKTYFRSFDECPIPAGYCESCKKIFAELDIKEEHEPIGLRYNND